ncbi:Pimeloyl-ACP methyl ester carboxylesterase [Allopseudospirillum japonicum]|uniref:Pimeloyl-ACP methyl ester carboxylesterase n=1 Tax=Allopseudospirillum japonicum TaxID=64971 RepID=A0A1H6TEG8_9GAMM|nr:alpha/beta hydrolase [Allopseudospirillum japonicum]SEI78448.1 Pimeloyl-ACP methyl ester carboxylesterase [Allopseudospirillum japonicum]
MENITITEAWISTPQGRLWTQTYTPTQVKQVPILLLHDSLGCVALWRDFPQALAQATQRPVIAYDRLGFGRSDAHPNQLTKDFIATEAQQGLRFVCEHLDIQDFILLGHSVGGGMATYSAAAYPDRCQALITLAAQSFVEPLTRAGIREAQAKFQQAGAMQSLQKYHGEKAAWVLASWTETWLSADFDHWNLQQVLPQVRCPMLAVHGDQDEYGSLQQVENFARWASGDARTCILQGYGHVPHRECPQLLIKQIQAFLYSLNIS